LEPVAVYTETGPALLGDAGTRCDGETLIDLLELAFGASVSSKTIMVEVVAAYLNLADEIGKLSQAIGDANHKSETAAEPHVSTSDRKGEK
jgi:hypothetical protein